MKKTINLGLLRKFCSVSNQEYEEPFNMYSWDGGNIVATNGNVILYVPNAKHQDLKEGDLNIKTQMWWVMGDIAEARTTFAPASTAAVDRIPTEILESLNVLPALEFLNVPRIRITVSGKTTRQRWEKINQNGLVYFRWDGGSGVCVFNPSEPKKAC